jgi:Bifunctional DNA primase/polymerase, N-terminal
MSGASAATKSASLDEALSLATQRLPCFPCRADKSPATPRGFHDASSDREVVQQLWRNHPGPLVGVPTGEMSGLHVLDIDTRKSGKTWFTQHRERLPATRVHRTRSGGLHLFFRHQQGLRCSVGRIAPGVDVRASGGYVIWWPAAGFPVLRDSAPAGWPEWLSVRLLPKPRPATPRVVVANELILMRLVRLLAGARPGERNRLTFWAACRAGEMVASGLLRADIAADVIAEAATRAGLPVAEAQRTAWSGIRASGGLPHG